MSPAGDCAFMALRCFDVLLKPSHLSLVAIAIGLDSYKNTPSVSCGKGDLLTAFVNIFELITLQ